MRPRGARLRTKFPTLAFWYSSISCPHGSAGGPCAHNARCVRQGHAASLSSAQPCRKWQFHRCLRPPSPGATPGGYPRGYPRGLRRRLDRPPARLSPARMPHGAIPPDARRRLSNVGWPWRQRRLTHLAQPAERDPERAADQDRADHNRREKLRTHLPRGRRARRSRSHARPPSRTPACTQ